MRDSNLMKFKDGFLVHACDSAGGIGALKDDVLKVPVEIIARYTLRTALMEVISVGSKPLSVSAEFANDPEYVRGAIDEIRKMIERFSLSLVISTEKNFKTSQTGLGISVVGFVRNPIIGNAHKGSDVFVAGYPFVGDEVLKYEDKILSFDDFLNLRNNDDVGEMIPVGSSGIFEEAKLLARNSDLDLKIKDATWLHKSAGPSTCVVFWSYGKPEIGIPIKKIGSLE
ncbi:MAG: alpha-ribazole kinase [Thermotogae bacterium]|nr:alpha-ribazole kinase [Thermotogota bacterium]